jgi:lipoprotein-anchoring transpeptidase ErfK/SrfK
MVKFAFRGDTLQASRKPQPPPINFLSSPLPSKIRVSIASQRLDLLSPGGEIIASCPVSTSRFGIGCEKGSFRTPTGQFRIWEKIGEGAAPWTIFKSRVSTGVLASPKAEGEEDLILSRILWLEGLDPENANTRDRYIYLHGTNQESLIGTPASHGCVRLSNLDMIEIYEKVAVGTPVEIIS